MIRQNETMRQNFKIIIKLLKIRQDIINIISLLSNFLRSDKILLKRKVLMRKEVKVKINLLQIRQRPDTEETSTRINETRWNHREDLDVPEFGFPKAGKSSASIIKIFCRFSSIYHISIPNILSMSKSKANTCVLFSSNFHSQILADEEQKSQYADIHTSFLVIFLCISKETMTY